MSSCCAILFFFVNDTATTEIYTLSLHDALPILPDDHVAAADVPQHGDAHLAREGAAGFRERKSTRLNSSHMGISYAVFCLKKKMQGTHASGKAWKSTASSRDEEGGSWG